jgi:energy-coupling factor transporter transmembrane protein EcfT
MSVDTTTANNQGEQQEWVRTFLFFMRMSSPLAGMHVISKFVLVLMASLCLTRMFAADRPDPVGVVILMALGFLFLWLSGVLRWMFRSYLVVIYPMLLSLFLMWVIFNPLPGAYTLVAQEIYSGVARIGVSVALAVLVAVPLIYYAISHKVFWGILGGIVGAIVVGATPLNLSWFPVSFPLYHSISLVISDQTLIIAGTKVIGYGAMVLMTLLLVLTTRDVEIIGALRKLPGMPFVVCLFTAVVVRSLNIAVLDFSTIRQAQVARGVNVQKRSLLTKLKDMAYLSVPLIANMMRRSTEITDALNSRGYELKSKPTTYREVKPIRVFDWLLIVASLALCAAILFGGVNVTELLIGHALGGVR